MSSNVVVIMGYGPGMGDIVERLLSEGASVYVGTSAEEMGNLPKHTPAQLYETDFASYDSVARPIQTAFKVHSRVDMVISYLPTGSAALSPSIPSASYPADLTLPIYLTRLATYFFFESTYAKPSAQGKISDGSGDVGIGVGTGTGSAGEIPLGGKGGKGRHWFILVGPEPPVAGTSLEPLQAAHANGLLGYVRSLAVQATAERFGVALICAPSGIDGSSVYKAITEATSRPVPTDPMKNNEVYVRDGPAWKRLSTGTGQLSVLPHMQAFGFRLGAALMIGGALKHSIRAQTIVAKRYSGTIRMVLLLIGAFLPTQVGPVLAVPMLIGIGYLIWGLSPGKKRIVRREGETCSVGVFLGSGGHTGEAIQLLSALDPARYTRRTYIFCTGDTMSVTKAAAFEATLKTSGEGSGSAPNMIEIPRARKVHQSIPSSVISTIYSFAFAVWKFAISPAISERNGKPMFDALLVNGPGTCVVIVAAFLLARLCGFATPQIIYVESFARVKTLSMSGKVLKPFVDRFVTQWDPDSKAAGKPEEELWLV